MSITLRLLPLLAAGCALAACGSLSGGTSGSGPTSSQASELAISVQNEVEAALPAVTVSFPGLPHNFPAIPNCPAVGPATDTDGDHIPNDQLRSFADPPCTLPGYRGGTLGVSGTVRIQDTDSAVGPSYRLTLTGLTWAFVDSMATRSYTEIRDGTRERFGTSTDVLVVNDLVTQRQRPPLATATVTLQTNTQYQANAAGAIVVDQPLPSGRLAISGLFTWHRATENWSLTVATPDPLQYDATCTTTAQRIKAGQITLTGTVNSGTGVLTVTWHACGTEPVRQWTATP